jgi:hypothetical protein
MTTLERTAYPTFKSSLTSTELDALYTPSAVEVAFAQAEATARRLVKRLETLGYEVSVQSKMPQQ